MAERKYTHGLAVSTSENLTVVDIGKMEIWDGADLSLIRDTLFRIVLQDGVDAFAIDMHSVQYVPSGFFGMLFDWMERGVEVRLLNPRERVRQMLWFRQFLVPVSENVYRLAETGAPQVDEGPATEVNRLVVKKPEILSAVS
ncbi:hypothetical protein [Planctomicrobium sp. SH664]|uniref:hypothetical protein n=1 Tax=Planctomicrobium sp. SH664 TaxID=3448125 RepID=UPI003F5B352D